MILAGIIGYLVVGVIFAANDFANDGEKHLYPWHDSVGWLLCMVVIWPLIFFDRTK